MQTTTDDVQMSCCYLNWSWDTKIKVIILITRASCPIADNLTVYIFVSLDIIISSFLSLFYHPAYTADNMYFGREYVTFSVACSAGLVEILTLSQFTLAGPVYTGMPLECHWLTQCTLGYHWATQRILAGYTGTPLEKLSWNSPYWNATWEALTFAAYTGKPLEGLWKPTQAPTHIVKHAE